MLISILVALVYICLAALVLYLVIYVLTAVVGLPIPAKVIQIIWVIFMLLVVIWLLATVPLGLPHAVFR